MSIKYFIKRFREKQVVYTRHGSLLYTVCYFFDWIISLILQGASINDYFSYRFFEKRANARNEYITLRRFHKLQRIANSQSNIKVCRQKNLFNKEFGSFLGREWIDLNDADKENFASFCTKHKEFFVKEVEGFCGNAVQKYSAGEGFDADRLHAELMSVPGAHFIAEECIRQHEELRQLHPWSVNTIRIVTLYDEAKDKVHVMSAKLRMGSGQNKIDNFHCNGICANIDVETGIIDSRGFDINNHTYVSHPTTGVTIVGFRIPKWKEHIEYVEKAARSIPKVRYIGWDVVLKDDGELCIIEANDNADHDIQQLHHGGMWREYKTILKGMSRV